MDGGGGREDPRTTVAKEGRGAKVAEIDEDDGEVEAVGAVEEDAEMAPGELESTSITESRSGWFDTGRCFWKDIIALPKMAHLRSGPPAPRP